MEYQIIICWIVLACLEGLVQGHYYDLVYRYGQPKRLNLHPFYVIGRICFLAMAWGALPYDEGADKYTHMHCFLFCSFLCMVYPVFHNGVLYTTRNHFAPDIYKNKFWANKEASGPSNPQEKDSWTELNVGWRIAMFTMGVIGFILLIYFE